MSKYFTSNNQSSSLYFPPFSQDEELSLMKQAIFYYKEQTNKPSYYSTESKEIYWINKEWLKKWKLFVNYQHYKNPAIPKHPRFIMDLPEINNEGIYIDPNSYYKEQNEQHIITPYFDDKFQAITKNVWNYFISKYGGGPEFKTVSTYNDNENDLRYIKISFMILPHKEQFQYPNKIEQLKEYITYINKKCTIKEMCERIERIINDNNLLNDDNNTTSHESFRFYNCQHSFTQIISLLVNESSKIANSTTLISPIDPFKMINLECIYSSLISEYVPDNNINDNEETYLFIVEQHPYIFSTSSKIKQGRCDYCNNHKILIYYCECEKVWYCSKECLNKDKQFHSNCPILMQKEMESQLCIEESSLSKYGIVGLQNLGNTCFMNSSLQCLSNCNELTNYFLSGMFLKHINKENPIGSKGLLATSYGVLIKNLWYGENKSYSPNLFKNAIGLFQKRFAGYQQHDTQEFLSYLLDGLHEDLNKVKQKPIIEREEGIGNDEIDSKNSWIDFLRRNQSVVGELFYGQFKSTLICPNSECNNISITYEPFISIPLPLGSKNEPFMIHCFYIYYNMYIKPIEIKLYFYKKVNVIHLRKKIAEILNIHMMSFIIVIFEEGSIKQVKSFAKMDDVIEMKGKMFLFEINPNIFYNELNKMINENDMELKKNHYIDIEKEEENEKELFKKRYKEVNNPVYKSECVLKEEEKSDDYGVDIELYVRTILICFNWYGVQYLLPRVVYIRKGLTGKELYRFIFEYYVHQIKEELNDAEDKMKSDEELFNKLFEPLIKKSSNKEEIVQTSLIPFTISVNINNPDMTTSQLNIMYDDMYTVDSLITKFYENKPSTTFFSINLSWSNNYSNIFNSLKGDINFMLKNITRDECMGTLNIYSCFSSFVSEEILEEDNSWYCPKCKQHQLAKKKIDIYKPPHILIVHLKRFNNNRKIGAKVEFPVDELLDISEYVVDPKEKEHCKYELFGVCNHSGSLSGGHYTAHAKNKGEWYYYNDSSVHKEESNGRIDCSEAYVLFYRRKGIEDVNLEDIYKKEFVEYEGMYEKRKETQTLKQSFQHKH